MTTIITPNSIFFKLLITAGLTTGLCSFTGVPKSKKRLPKTVEQRINSLMVKMTLADEIGHTSQRGASSRVKEPLTEMMKNAVR